MPDLLQNTFLKKFSRYIWDLMAEDALRSGSAGRAGYGIVRIPSDSFFRDILRFIERGSPSATFENVYQLWTHQFNWVVDYVRHERPYGDGGEGYIEVRGVINPRYETRSDLSGRNFILREPSVVCGPPPELVGVTWDDVFPWLRQESPVRQTTPRVCTESKVVHEDTVLSFEEK